LEIQNRATEANKFNNKNQFEKIRNKLENVQPNIKGQKYWSTAGYDLFHNHFSLRVILIIKEVNVTVREVQHINTNDVPLSSLPETTSGMD
jgi:hypothetical protein